MKKRKKQIPIFSAIKKIDLNQSDPERPDTPHATASILRPETSTDHSVPPTSDPGISPMASENRSNRSEPLPREERVGEVYPLGEPEASRAIRSVGAPDAPGVANGRFSSPATEAPMIAKNTLGEGPSFVSPKSPLTTSDQTGDDASLSHCQGPIRPLMKLAATSHDFGHLLIGQSENWQLSVHNEGDADLMVIGLEGLPAAGFKLIKPPLLPRAIPPRGVLNLTIEFAPDTKGGKRVQLLIRSEQVDGPWSEIVLSGTGIEVISSEAGLCYTPIFNSLDMVFVYIKPGTFMMGSPDAEQGRRDDELQHEVTIAEPYYIQTTPVTQRQWQALMGTNPSKFSDGGDDCPVEGVSWTDCQGFIKTLNSTGEGIYRLPTEAEWEYACRAGSVTGCANGDISQLFCDYDANLDALGWYCYNSANRTHPVGLKNPNPWGLYDMHGNVGEWCQDWYEECYPSGETDPKGPPSGTEKVVRGGSWFASAKNCRASSRFKWSPQSRINLHVIGFRLVREV